MDDREWSKRLWAAGFPLRESDRPHDEVLAEFRARVANGDGLAALEAIAYASEFRLPVPHWAGFALRLGLELYRTTQAATLDEAFNVPDRKTRGRWRDALQRQQDAPHVVDLVRRCLRAGYLADDNSPRSAFAKVAKLMNERERSERYHGNHHPTYSVRNVREIYYQHRARFPE